MSRTTGAGTDAAMYAPHPDGAIVTTPRDGPDRAGDRTAVGGRRDSKACRLHGGAERWKSLVLGEPATRRFKPRPSSGPARGGRAVWIRVSDGPAMERFGRLCTNHRLA
jgi:hypothetical protein